MSGYLRELANQLPSHVQYCREEIDRGGRDYEWAFKGIESIMEPLGKWLEMELQLEELRIRQSQYESEIDARRQREFIENPTCEDIEGIVAQIASGLREYGLSGKSQRVALIKTLALISKSDGE